MNNKSSRIINGVVSVANWWLGRKLLTRIHEFIARHSLVVKTTSQKTMVKNYLPLLSDWGLDWRNYQIKIIKELAEEFYLPGHQGVKLNCWVYYQTNDHNNDQWVLFLHDWGENIFKVLPYADLYYRLGYCVLLYDAREHGLNAGDELVFSFGYFDKFDLIKILLWLNQKFKPTDIILHGRGIGGTIILEAWKLLPQSIKVLIKGVVVENPWMWPLQTLASWPCRQGLKFGPQCYRYGLKWAIKKQDRYLITDVCPAKNPPDAKIKKPLLVLASASQSDLSWNLTGTEQFWQNQKQHWHSVTYHPLHYDQKLTVPIDRSEYQNQIWQFFHTKVN